MRSTPRRYVLRQVLLGLTVLASLTISPAGLAAEDPKGDNTVSELVVIANRAPTVEELDVVARAQCLASELELRSDPPKVVSTYPGQNQTVSQGLLILRVTFDRPMSCSGFLAFEGKDPCSTKTQIVSQREQDFLMSFDHKTIRVACFVRPGERYTFWMNPDPATPFIPAGVPWPSFTSLQGMPLASKAMTFATSKGPPVQTIADALSADPETVLSEVYRPAQKTQARLTRRSPALSPPSP